MAKAIAGELGNMESTSLKLSVLDQSPAAPGESAVVALEHTIQLAQYAEQWGYNRFWVAEHHGSTRNMGSSPEVLISHLLARTERIRVGSGGVMLQHYSPYKVAENFNVLASLAPGRVDLGIGRGPGGMPQSTRALRPHGMDGSDPRPLEEKLVELRQFLDNRLVDGSPFKGLTASPLPPTPAELFLLGTTASSAEIAANLHLPYIFALFLNGEEAEMRRAIDLYRRRSNDGGRFHCRAMLALPVIVADTDVEAAGLAGNIHVVRIRLASGRTFTVFSEEAAREFGNQSGEEFTYRIQPANVIHGSPATVSSRLMEIHQEYQVDEVFIVTAVDDFARRLHSYKLLSQAMLKVEEKSPATGVGAAEGER